MLQDARAQLQRATELHQAGQLEDAIGIYRRLAKAPGAGFEIHRLLALALLQAQRPREALIAARRVIEVFPGSGQGQVLLGAAHLALGEGVRALAAFEAAEHSADAPAEARFMAGNALCTLGRLAEGVARYNAVLADDPRAVEALANRALALSRLGHAEAALADFEALVAMQPWIPMHRLSLASAYLEMARFPEAVREADEALRQAPRLAEAHYLKAQALAGQCRYDAAREAIRKAIALEPHQAGFKVALSWIERHAGAPDRALVLCDAMLAEDPANRGALHERAEVRRLKGDLRGALDDLETAIAGGGAVAPILVSTAGLLGELGRPQEMRAAIDAALQVDPHYPFARHARSLDELAQGRWDSGWADHESRARLLPPAFLPLGFPRWDGSEPVSDLVVVGEGGLDDLLLFGRLLRRLAERGIAARLVCEPRHAALLGRIDARIPVVRDLGGITPGTPGLRWAPLASLPLLLGPDPAAWPGTPYLTAPPERIARWSHRWEGGLAVGIQWRGSPGVRGEAGDSVPLAAFAPLAALEGVTLVSLQQGAAADEIDAVPFGLRILRFDPELDADGSLLDTAGLMQHLDLTVTVDGALAHLAGARGHPGFVALKAVPRGWAWGRAGEGSVLYPSLRLFRQEGSAAQAGDWTAVFERIAEAVRVRLDGRAAPGVAARSIG